MKWPLPMRYPISDEEAMELARMEQLAYERMREGALRELWEASLQLTDA